jgi:sortase A
MNNRFKRIIKPRTMGTILLIIGVLILLFPFVNNYLTRISQKTPPAAPQIINDEKPDTSLSLDPAAPEFLPQPGHLYIPSINLDLDVGYGVNEADLKKGPGFYPQSAHPSAGNVCIAGHRNAYGNPFMDLDKLKSGDQIELTYDEKKYTYEVEKIFVVDEYDWSVIDPTPYPAITLTTCHPLFPVDGKYDRLIVRAKQISSDEN